ncbi:MAG: domain S-box protein [Polaromonas sp.]|nr:domain S-box protein [Polaromonas sp.]
MTTANPVNLLLVDNEPDSLELLQEFLAAPGVDLTLSSSGLQALRNIETFDFAVIVLDLHMPGLSGFELAQRIRNCERSKSTPIIFVTGADPRAFPIEQAYALGAVDYLIKPVNPTILRAKVAVFIELYRNMVRKHHEIEREHLLKEVQAANAQLADVFKQAPAFMAVLWGPAHVFEMINDRYLALVGDRNQIGLPVRQALPELAGQGFFELLDAVFVTGEPFVGVDMPIALQRRPDRPVEVRSVDFVYTALRDADGAVSGVLIHGVDQTERNQAEAALRTSEARYRMLFESMDQGFCIVQMIGSGTDSALTDFRILELNAMAHKHTGLDGSVGATIRELVPNVESRWIERFAAILLSGQSVHFEDFSKSLNRWLDVFAYPVGNPGRRTIALLFSDVTARKESEKALQQHAFSLAEADRRKTVFLATLAHELRNPLAPITAGLAMVRMQGDPARASQTLDMVGRQVGQMVILVDDLLDIARIGGGKLELKKELVELQSIVSVAIETSQPHLQEKHHALQVQISNEPLVLEADRTRITQVIANLLNNAAKYTPCRGRIELSVHRENAKNDKNDEVVISVADNGIGLAQDSLDTIFEMFSQGDLSANRTHGGLGIGLSLVRQLVQMHGGAVNATSSGLGKGSTFTVRLPLSSVMALPALVQKPMGGIAPASTKQLRILVIDDHGDAAKSLATVLALKGHGTEVAHSGLSALQIAAEFRPDVAFVDIGMPGMDGYETARAMRKIAGLEAIILIALTGWGTKADRARSATAGFDHHLTKPAALEAVDALLAKIACALQ